MKNLRNLTTLVAMLTAVCAMAVPAKRDARQYVQPDGSTVTLRLVGDEFHHYYLTTDGCMVLSQGDAYYFAEPDADGMPRPSAVRASNPGSRSDEAVALLARADKGAMAAKLTARRARSARKPAQSGIGTFPGATFPTTGNVKGLVILVQYSNVNFRLSSPFQYFHDMLNKQGFSEYGGTGSARDYFIDSSNGRFTPQFDVYGPVTLPQKRNYYGGNDSYGDDKAPEMMVVHACQALDATVDFSQYDTDGDGYVDNVYIFYAGQGEASGGAAETVWPHSWSLEDAGRNLVCDGVKINAYACSNEWEDNAPDGIGTFVHEFSHVMGLPDLYTTDYGAAETVTPGDWSVLDYGPYNNDGRTPPTYSIFERNAMGWAELITLSADNPCTVELDNILNSNTGCLIPTSKTNEFFLIENRQPTSWDTYLPGHGMLVWHIDYNASKWSSNEVNNTKTHQYVDIEEANGNPNNTSTTAMAGYTFPGRNGQYSSFTDNTTPSMKTWAGKSLGIPLTNITETSSGIVSFDVCGGGENPGPGPDPDPATGEYVLVTSATQLHDGDKIIIATSDEGYAIGEQATNNRRGTEVSIAAGRIASPSSDVAVLTLEAGSEGGYTGYHLKAADGYLYAASPSKNQLKTQATTSAHSLAVITVSGGSTSVTFSASSNRNVLQYNPNNGSPIFACYKNATQSPVEVYRLSGSTGIEGIGADSADGPAEYFTLDGIRVERPTRGIYLRRTGPTVTKVLIR